MGLTTRQVELHINIKGCGIMRIGQFVTLLNTTKETVRHYEDLNLITPKWKNSFRDYGEKDIQDFQVIVELKNFGLTLKEIQLIFNLKNALGCGDKQLVEQVFEQLSNHLQALQQAEEEIKNRRIKLNNVVKQLEDLL